MKIAVFYSRLQDFPLGPHNAIVLVVGDTQSKRKMNIVVLEY